MVDQSRLAVHRAIPAGSRRLRGRTIERDYLTALQAWPAFLELRPAARQSVTETAKQLARHASYTSGTTRPTRARLCALGGLSVSTWQRARRRLQAWGFLGLVTPGTTPDFRPMALQHLDDGNTAAVYVICAPRIRSQNIKPAPASPQARPQTDPPTLSSLLESGGFPARDEPTPERGRRSAAAHSLRPVVRLMRKAAGQGITEGWIWYLTRGQLAAGWTLRDLAHAIDYQPSGRQHRYDTRPRSSVGWLRWRLAQWRTPGGELVPSLTEQRAAYRARLQASAAATRASLAAAAAGHVDPAPHAAAIRARLGWSKRERTA